MDTFQLAKMDTLKAFVTRRVENFTPKYGRGTVAEPRQCLFIGTTNRPFSYQDTSGARRFWPVPCAEANPEKLASMREQLFAEALVAFAAGEQWWPDAALEDGHIRPVQEERREIEPWTERIAEWLSTHPVNVTLRKVWVEALNGPEKDYAQEHARRIATAMRELEWEEDKSLRRNNARVWGKTPGL